MSQGRNRPEADRLPKNLKKEVWPGSANPIGTTTSCWSCCCRIHCCCCCHCCWDYVTAPSLYQQEEECGDVVEEVTVCRYDAGSGVRQASLQTETPSLPVTFAGCVLRCGGVLAICCDGVMLGGGERAKHGSGLTRPSRRDDLGPCHDQMDGQMADLGAQECLAAYGGSTALLSRSAAAGKAPVGA